MTLSSSNSPRIAAASSDRNDAKKHKKKRKKKHKKEGKRKKNEDDKRLGNPSMVEDDDDDNPSASSSTCSDEAKVKDEFTTSPESRRKRRDDSSESEASPHASNKKAHRESPSTDKDTEGRPFVESSALEFNQAQPPGHNVSLLLFYQYVEPDWSNEVYKDALRQVEVFGKECKLTGRMRVGREGLNCTLTGSNEGIKEFCYTLRRWKPIFRETEFKLTHNLPEKQRFPALKIIKVTELVNYGLNGDKAPPIHQYQGVHLEPADYHKKLAEDNTVVIDVRNHYEAVIGRFDPPTRPGETKWIDPKMRKSTEFPVWLDDPETRKQLHGKSVLMYCTGGIRCERASALLKYKMETDPEVADLDIKGVYQLQGGIDKYFKEYPDGGYWKGKNYVFDKRFAHAPPAVAAAATTTEDPHQPSFSASDEPHEKKLAPAIMIMGKCEACSKPWDMFRGKRRCPTCGVPSLICKSCWQAHEEGTDKIDRSVRCDLCVEQNIWSKKDLREKEEQVMQEYETKLVAKGHLHAAAVPNPDNVTRLYLKNMCKNHMTEEILMSHLPGITHIVWRMDRKSGTFFGQGWVEMESPEAAARAVAKSGEKVLGRPLYIEFQPPDRKDAWPPKSSAVKV